MQEFTTTGEFLDAVMARLELPVTTPHIIALDGRSGSGKTTLAANLAARLAQDGISHGVLHMEDLYQGWNGLAAGVTQWVKNALAFKAGSPLVYFGWDWQEDKPTGPHLQQSKPGTVLICEGVGAAQGSADTVCWIEADSSTRKKRALIRDGEIFRPYWEMWARQEEELLATNCPRSKIDMLLHTTHPGSHSSTRQHNRRSVANSDHRRN